MSGMGDENLHEAELESRWEAAPAVLLIIGLQVALAVVSQHAHWKLWWAPVVGLGRARRARRSSCSIPLAWSRPRHQLEQLGKRRMVALALLAVISVGNGLALVALIGSLHRGPRAQRRRAAATRAVTIWTTNVIVVRPLVLGASTEAARSRRREPNPPPPDFQFPQMDNPKFAEPGLAAAPARLHLRLVHELDRIQPDGRDAAHAPGEGADARPSRRRLAITVLLVAARAVNILR